MTTTRRPADRPCARTRPSGNVCRRCVVRHTPTMADKPESRERPAVVTSSVWPVPRTGVIPTDGDEQTMLEAYLDYYRETFDLKCSGVVPVRLSERSSPPSTMSLHGLARHLAGVERWWFAINFAGLDLPMLYYSDDDPDQDFESLSGDPLEAVDVWRTECVRSRGI